MAQPASGSQAGATGSDASPAGAGAGAPGRAGAAAGGGGALAAPAGQGGAGANAAGASAGGAGAGGESVAGRSGSSAAAGAAAVVPVAREGKYVLEVSDITMEIDPQVGGRITKCQVAGQNLLTGPEIDATNYGSTFWPSPQQRWNWPPVPELDNQPYTASVVGETLVLTSRVGERVKVEVAKKFTARPNERAIDVEYVLTNRDPAAMAWAPWEITRVAPNGLTFFPTGMRTVNTQLQVVTMGRVSWYDHDPSAIAMGGQKFTGDGSGGWLAHVAGDKLLLKTFEDVAPDRQAPAPEAEIEIYAASGYVEIEPQGPYTQLMPGQSVSWTVRWLPRQLPAGMMPAAGSAELVSFVEATIRGSL